MAESGRERLLLLAAGDLPIGKDLLAFDEEELLRIGLTLATRRLLVIICNHESAPKDIIPAARLIFQLNGKDVGADADDPEATKEGREKISSELVRAMQRSEAAG